MVMMVVMMMTMMIMIVMMTMVMMIVMMMLMAKPLFTLLHGRDTLVSRMTMVMSDDLAGLALEWGRRE